MIKGPAAIFAPFLIAFGLMTAPTLAPGVSTPAKAQVVRRAINKIRNKAATRVDDFLEKLAEKGTADLEAALAMASAVDPDTQKPVDPIAAACYPALIKFIKSLPHPAAGSETELGPAQLFQRKRLLQRLVHRGVPDYLRIGCAPLVQDELATLARIGAIVGISVASGGLILP